MSVAPDSMGQLLTACCQDGRFAIMGCLISFGSSTYELARTDYCLRALHALSLARGKSQGHSSESFAVITAPRSTEECHE
jgi:hypothetical protein